MRILTLLYTLLIINLITIKAQTVTTFAGIDNSANPTANFNNDTASPQNAYFYQPQGIAWDPSGYMYITERNKIRVLINGKFYNRSGKLGNGSFSQGYKDGAGISGELAAPSDIISDANGNMYIVDSENHSIRKLAAYTSLGQPQSITTFAGAPPPTAIADYKNATGTNARFNTPKGIVMDKNGNFYVSDWWNFCIRKISSGGVVTNLAGIPGTFGSTDGTNGTNSTFGGPWGMAMMNDNELIVADQYNSSIRKVNISSGKTTTITGKALDFNPKDGTLAEARFKSPEGIVFVNGLIYVNDVTAIRVIDIAKNTVSTFAGSLNATGNVDGTGSDARFGKLSGMAYDGFNALYVTDVDYHLIKKITINNLAPSSDFTASKVNLMVNEESTLTDNSGGKPATSRKWTVTSQTGSTANVDIVNGNPNSDASITVKFSAVGFYTVKLDVTNEFGSDSRTKNSYFNVSTLGINNLGSSNLNLLVYPNPAHGFIMVNGVNFTLSNADIILKDIAGRELLSISNASGTAQLNIDNISAGMYVLQVIQGGAILQRRIQIQ